MGGWRGRAHTSSQSSCPGEEEEEPQPPSGPRWSTPGPAPETASLRRCTSPPRPRPSLLPRAAMASGATPAAVKVRLVVPAAAVLRALYDPAPARGDRASGPCAQPVRPRRGGEGLRPVSPVAASGGEGTIAESSPNLWSQLHPQRAAGRQALKREGQRTGAAPAPNPSRAPFWADASGRG